jgi:hypothetical protein
MEVPGAEQIHASQVWDIAGTMLCARPTIRHDEECGHCNARDLGLGRRKAAPSCDGIAVVSAPLFVDCPWRTTPSRPLQPI